MTTAIPFIGLLAAQGAVAQGAFELDEITAFANLTPTEISRTGATVDIVTEEELRAQGNQQLSDFLSRRAGISASANGGPGTATNLRIRGLAGQYIAVRIDGIDVTDPSGTQVSFDFGRLTTDNVSRVEIIKGSQSALYGTAAVAGVINITTRRATEEGTTASVELEAGSYDTFAGSLNVSTLTDRVELSFTASRVQTDGFSAADENAGNTEADAYDSTRYTFFGAYDISDAFTVGLSGFWQDSTSEFDNFQSVPPFLPDDGPFLTEQEDATTWGLRAFAEYAGETVDHSFALSTFENDRFNNFGSGTSTFLGEREKIEYLGTTSLSSTTLSFGGEYADESFSSSDSFGGAASGDRQIGAVFGEAQISAGADTDLSLAARYDDYSDFGDFVSGRLALAYRPAGDTVLRAVLSNGFRAPSLFELNDPVFGDPNLTAEESLNFELGVDQVFVNGAAIAATLFWTEIEDLIDFDFGAGGYIQTTGTTKTQGVELTGSLPLGSQAQVFGNYTYTDAKAPDGDQLRRVPTDDLTIGIEGQMTDRIDGIFTAQFVSGLVDVGPLDDYVVANATINYAISETATAYLRIANIFDEQYQTVEGYGTSDRAFYVGLRASF